MRQFNFVKERISVRQYSDVKTLLFFTIFIIIYLLPGIYGHTPWKQDENYSFGIIQSMYESGNWLVPTNAGEPFMEKPPLYYWVATIMVHLLSNLLPLHDAARTATFLFSTLNFYFFILLAKRVFQSKDLSDYRIWLAFAVYICAPGALRHSHDMFTDTALTAGATIGLYGLMGLIRQEKVSASALWLCLGTVFTMLSKGVFIPGVLWISLILSPLFLPQCRSKNFWRPSLIAGGVALLLILPWPALLYFKHPDLFMVWFWDNNIGRFLGFSVSSLGAGATPTLIPEAIVFFSLPSGILATLYFLRHPVKRLFNQDEYAITMYSLSGLILLQISATSRALYLLPFIAPMAILGSRLLLQIKPKPLQYFSYFASIFWSGLILLLWCVYFLKLTHDQKEWLATFDRWLPMGYEMHFSWLPFIFAFTVTVLWFCRRYLYGSANQPLRAALDWGAGITATWGILFTLFIGWIDYAKGYEGVFSALRNQLVGQYRESDCMASYKIGESEAPMLYYFTGILHQRQTMFEQPEHCRWLIILSDHIPPPPEGMELFWYGNRPGEKRNNLVVYRILRR